MQQDLKGMTLAELRQVNTQLDTERLTEQEALRTEYLAMQAEYNDMNDAAENDYGLKIGEMLYKYRQQIEALEADYKKLGAHIGTLMDRRKFCESVEEIDKLRQQIDEAMEKRQELRTQRRVLNENFHRALEEEHRKARKARKARYTEHLAKQREFRQARIAIAKKYAALHEEVRKVIGLRKAEEREAQETEATV